MDSIAIIIIALSMLFVYSGLRSCIYLIYKNNRSRIVVAREVNINEENNIVVVPSISVT